MAETSSLLNCRTGNRTAGSNPALTALHKSGYSAVRLAHLLWEQGVAGSNPATPTVENEGVR